MIVVDSSVLISFLSRFDTPETRMLSEVDPDAIVVGDLVLLEVLRGARDVNHAAGLQRRLMAFRVEPMLDERIAIQAADNFRHLRTLGKTMGKTTDLIIGTFCLERDYSLLHNDHDFDPMVAHLGLRVI